MNKFEEKSKIKFETPVQIGSVRMKIQNYEVGNPDVIVATSVPLPRDLYTGGNFVIQMNDVSTINKNQVDPKLPNPGALMTLVDCCTPNTTDIDLIRDLRIDSGRDNRGPKPRLSPVTTKTYQ